MFFFSHFFSLSVFNHKKPLTSINILRGVSLHMGLINRSLLFERCICDTDCDICVQKGFIKNLI